MGFLTTSVTHNLSVTGVPDNFCHSPSVCHWSSWKLMPLTICMSLGFLTTSATHHLYVTWVPDNFCHLLSVCHWGSWQLLSHTISLSLGFLTIAVTHHLSVTGVPYNFCHTPSPCHWGSWQFLSLTICLLLGFLTTSTTYHLSVTGVPNNSHHLPSACHWGFCQPLPPSSLSHPQWHQPAPRPPDSLLPDARCAAGESSCPSRGSGWPTLCTPVRDDFGWSLVARNGTCHCIFYFKFSIRVHSSLKASSCIKVVVSIFLYFIVCIRQKCENRLWDIYAK